MRARIFHHVPLSRLLIISYLGLLIFVAFVRFIEYKQTRQAGSRINIVAKTTNQRLRLLIAMRKNNVSLQILATQNFFNDDSNNIKRNERLIRKGMILSDSNFAAYNKLIKTPEERIIFSSLKEWDGKNNLMIDSLLKLNFPGNFSKYNKIHSFIARLKNVFENLHNSNHQLSDLISKEAEKEINDITQYIFHLAKRKEISSYVIIFLLFILALTIGNTLRKIRRTENKYRLLFDLGPLPTYFVDTVSLNILEVNRAAVNKYGYSKEEFLKMTIFKLRYVQERELLKKITDSLSGEGNIFEGKAVHYKKNGEAMHVEITSHTIVLENKKVFLVTINDVTEKENLEREIDRIIITTQEQERREIGIELHDNVCQLLASSQLYLDMMKQRANPIEENLKHEAKKYIAQALTEIRNLSHLLAPAFIEDESLVNAINDLLNEMNADKKFRIEYSFDKEFLKLEMPNDIKLNLYRILQEQMKNIRKYSSATTIKVTLLLNDNVFRMLIYDNGVGFNTETVKKGIGLINMRKRTESFSGKLIIDAAPQKGCSITVEIPISTTKAA